MSPFTTPFAHAAFLGTFLRFMAFALRRGVPISDFLDEFARSQPMPPRCRDAMNTVAQAVRSGTSFSHALETCPDVFPAWLVAGVRAGERGGHMDRVAEHLAGLQSRRLHFLRLLERDWAYPMFLSGSIVLLLGALGLLMLPDFVDTASNLANAQPKFQQEHWVLSSVIQQLAAVRPWMLVTLFLLAGIAIAYALHAAARSEWGQRARDAVRRAVRYLPYYGRAQQELALAGFCDCAAGLLSQGVVLHEALGLSADSVPDDSLREQLKTIARRAEGGEPLGDLLATVEALPHVFVFKLRLGIPEALLASSFNELADDCREDAQSVVRTAQAILQPFVILVMGGLVAALWLFVFMVLFGLLGGLQEG